MLEKTLALLTGIKPGTHLPADAECYVPAEIDELGRVLQRLVYAPSSIRKVLQDKYGVTLTRGDFYSEIPTITEIEKSFATPSLLTLDAIFPENAIMLAELERLTEVSGEFDPPVTSDRKGEYSWQGNQFSFSDAMSYYAMIRTRKPRTIVEIGCGWSTLVAQIACARNGMGRIICIEPYPNEFLREMIGIELVQKRAQDMETGFFNNALSDGDLLFIDSTHTVKHDSDCLHIYLRILPAIAADITIHVHDIYFPDPLSLTLMRESQIFWNEQYLLYAYMYENPRVRTLYGSRYHYKLNRSALDRFMHGRYGSGGASFWFEQRKAGSPVEGSDS